MKPIKMIATDLDGTLLQADKSISRQTFSALEKCRQGGIKLVYATGRGSTASYIVPPDLFDAGITQNGGMIHLGEKLISSISIDYKISMVFLDACTKKGLKASSEFEGIHYSNFDCEKEWPGSNINFKIVDYLEHKLNAEKLYVVIKTSEEEDFVLNNLPDELYLSLARDGLGMIMHRDATKGKALEKLAGIWNIDRSEIIAFGDDTNDIDMLQYAGSGIAMSNAVEEVKAAADFITKSNDEDGIAIWLKENLH